MKDNQTEKPNVFISHSSTDKERFVVEFAKRLRGKGIDAWLDEWEMQIGDSLVDKIFEEGIKNCQKFILILSKDSINSKWVKEELDAGIVKKIEKQTTIMPIIIDDDIEIPTVLIATVWKKIPNLESYDDEFEEIVNAILGVSERPPLGELPKYAIDTVTIGGLTQIDSKIFKIIVDYILQGSKWAQWLTAQDIKTICNENDITDDQLEDSLEILSDEFYIDMTLTSQGWLGSSFKPTDTAIIEYCEYYIEDFDLKVQTMISMIINENIMISNKLAEGANLNHIIVWSLINEWKENDYIKFTLHLGNGILGFQRLSASGKRYFKEMLNQ